MGTETTNKQVAKRKGQQSKGLQDDGDAAVACGQGRTFHEVIFKQKSKRREKMNHGKSVRGKKNALHRKNREKLAQSVPEQ